MTESLTCKFCGHTGEDVATKSHYVGGKGYIPMILCLDEVACFERWNQKHRLPPVLSARLDLAIKRWNLDKALAELDEAFDKLQRLREVGVMDKC